MSIKLGEVKKVAGKSLKIDDDSCRAVGSFFLEEGENFDEFLKEYVEILKRIKNKSIVSGEIASSLELYIQYADFLQGKIGDISSIANEQVAKFIKSIDNADQYLF